MATQGGKMAGFSICSRQAALFLIEVRRIKYLNNLVEQDHRGIKRLTKPTLGFKSFESAEVTIAGIELHRMLKKGQMENAGDTPAWKQFYSLAA